MKKVNLIVSCGMFALLACASHSDSVMDLDELQARLEHFLAAPQVCQSVIQCEGVALGHSPCGGPAEYRVLSALNPDAGKIRQLAELHRQLSAEQHRSEGRMGICRVVEAPLWRCEIQRCVAAESLVQE